MKGPACFALASIFLISVAITSAADSKKEMQSCKVLISAPNVPKIALDLLKRSCELRIVDDPPTKEQLLNKVKGVDGIFWAGYQKLDNEILGAAGSNLKMVAAMAVGVDNIDLPELKKRGIKLSNTPNVLDDSVAEVALMLALAASKRLQEGRVDMENGNWKIAIDYLLGRDIKYSTVGIVGLGNVGIAIAKKFQAMNASKILYTGHKIKEEGTKIGAEFVPLDRLLSESDYVVASVPLTNETKNMFNDTTFGLMKNTSIFVNVARGAVVNQDALIRVLKEKKIFAAGIDVMTPEPLPKDHELLSIPNLVILPHLGSATERTRNGMAELAAQNLLLGLGDSPLLTPVLP